MHTDSLLINALYYLLAAVITVPLFKRLGWRIGDPLPEDPVAKRSIVQAKHNYFIFIVHSSKSTLQAVELAVEEEEAKQKARQSRRE